MFKKTIILVTFWVLVLHIYAQSQTINNKFIKLSNRKDENPWNDGQTIQVTELQIDSLRLRLVGHEPLNGDCRGISISGFQAILCNGGGVYSVDISDPTHPQKRDVIGIDTWTNAADVHAIGNYAYVSECWWYEGKGRLRVIDISNPMNLKELGRSDRLGDYARDIYVSGDWAYLALDDAGLYILSISDPAKPGTIIGKYDCPDAIWGVYVKDNYAYVAGDDNLWIYDITNAPIATLIGQCNEIQHGWGVYVSDNYAYVADQEYGLRIINVSDPANPYLVSTFDTPGEARHVQVVNNFAYIADGFYGLRIIDVSNPNTPTEIGYYLAPAGYFLDLQVAGDYIYVSASGSNGLYVFQYDESINKIIYNSKAIIPSEFSLLQNYPNPFNTGTRINFELSISSRVKITVFNLMGQEVRTLIDQDNSTGYFEVVWDGKDNSGRRLSSGVYLYRMEARDFVQTKRMVFQ